MGFDTRLERRRVRWFFAGLLVISAVIDIVGALLIQHQTRTAVLEALLPASVTLGGRTGAVLSGLALLLLAGGIARGKRVAFRLTLVVLVATVAFELVKDLDFEGAALFAWILAGLWWFRHYFDADSDPTSVRWGVVVLVAGLFTAVLYAIAGAALLQNQLQPEFGFFRTIESLVAAVAGGPTRYRALTERADWFLSTLPVVSYALVIVALIQLLRPVLAPRAAAAERERVRELIKRWGRNYISHLAVHGNTSYHWLDDTACVAFTLRGRTALALGDPIGPPEKAEAAIQDFVAYCDRQDWIGAFYQVDEPAPYRSIGLTLVQVGAEALLRPEEFSLTGKKRHDVRSAVNHCARQGVRLVFGNGPDMLADHREQLVGVSSEWLQSRRSPELGYSLGTLSTLSDPDIIVGLAFAGDGRLEAFVSWLPVPARSAWTLDLMRRRPGSTHGAMESLIVRSVDEARSRGVREMSLGMTPRVIAVSGASRGFDAAWRAMYWGLDRFQRSRSLRHFKEKFGPRWEERYLVVPNAATLPEVLVALVRAHLPPLCGRGGIASVDRCARAGRRRPPGRRLGRLRLCFRGGLGRARVQRPADADEREHRHHDQRRRLGQVNAQRGVERDGAWTDEGHRCDGGEKGQVELESALAVEEAFGQMNESDGDEHRAGDGEARQGIEQAQGQPDASRKLGDRRCPPPRSRRADTHVVHGAGPALDAGAAPPSEQLLGAMGGQGEPDHESKNQNSRSKHCCVKPPGSYYPQFGRSNPERPAADRRPVADRLSLAGL